MKKKLTHSLEDYLETIYLIKLEYDKIKLKKIAESLEVRPPSALGAIKTLEKQGYLIHKKYKGIELTDIGEKKARLIFKKHRIIYNFIKNILGVNEKKAEEEACNLEHMLSDETIDRFINFGDYLKKRNFDLIDFQNYYNKNRKPEIENQVIRAALSDVKEAKLGVISKINGSSEIRKEIINKGILPKLKFKIEKIDDKYFYIKIEHSNIKLDFNTASNIIVEIFE
ncbi:MAG: iron dependent repressor, metal binding and dimerization domain protein [Candidatus Muiribacteriota bacterium]